MSEIEKLTEHIAELEQAVGLMTTAKPSMLVRVDDPLGMAQEVVAEVSQTRLGRDAWIETAKQAQRNTDYYRGLVVRVGEMFGEAARIQDDGGRVEDVLCAKVPELVEALKRERDDALKALAVMRRLLWQYHGHTGLYGDDGEMQCGLCPLDFKRDNPVEIEAVFCRRSLAAVDPALEPAP